MLLIFVQLVTRLIITLHTTNNFNTTPPHSSFVKMNSRDLLHVQPACKHRNWLYSATCSQVSADRWLSATQQTAAYPVVVRPVLNSSKTAVCGSNQTLNCTVCLLDPVTIRSCYTQNKQMVSISIQPSNFASHAHN